MQTDALTIHVKFFDENGFALYAVQIKNGKSQHYQGQWAEKAFTWHTSSLYGTLLRTIEIEEYSYVLLSHYEAFEFFLTKPWNEWINFSFGTDCIQFANWAHEIHTHIDSNTLLPYADMDAEGKLRLSWKTDIDEAPPWVEWFSSIIRNVCLKQYMSSIKIPDKYTTAYFASLALTDYTYTDEDSFYQMIHWKPKPKAYELSIRICEPQNVHPDSNEQWSLQVMVRSNNIPDAPWLVYDAQHPEIYNFLKKEDMTKIHSQLENWSLRFPFLRNKMIMGTSDETPIGRMLTDDEAYIFFMEIAPMLIAHHITVLLPSWWQTIQKKGWTLQANFNAPINDSMMPLVWRDFDWKIVLGQAKISEAEFIAALQLGKKWIKVGEQWIPLDAQILKKFQSYVQKAQKKGFSLREMIAGQAKTLLEKREEPETKIHEESGFEFSINMQLSAQWKQMFEQLFSLDQMPHISFEKTLNGKLRDYQQTAANWLCMHYTQKLGAILADDMGLGKTIVVIAYFLYLRGYTKTLQSPKTEKDTPILVICPTSLLGNWEAELQKFAPKLKIAVHYGAQRIKNKEEFTQQAKAVDIILTSYGLTTNDVQLFTTFTWQSIVLDEAQNIKNAATKQSRIIRSLLSLHRIALTGTPIENRLLELWSLFDFIQPGYLGNMTEFKQAYTTPIENDGKNQKMQALKILIQPFLLRRTKKDAQIQLNLPKKLEQKAFLHLNAEQIALYDQLVKHCKENQNETNRFKQKGLIMHALNQFKMICDHPALYLKETKNQKWAERSPKLDYCIELTENILLQHEQVLIFTQYIKMAHILQFVLEKQFACQIPFFYGGLDKKERDQIIVDFQRGAFPILLLSLRAGGTGLNLTAANHVIHFDRWWNPAVENQATDRVHRIGQKQFVHVHKLIMKNTIEEKIDQLMSQKQDLSDQILSTENWLLHLSFEEFLQMITI